MKSSKKYKQKIPAKVGFEGNATEHSKLVETIDHINFVRPGEANQQPDEKRYSQTRGETEALLCEKGLSQMERNVVLARVFDRKSFREIGKDVGRSRTWVQNTLKRVMPSLTAMSSQFSQKAMENKAHFQPGKTYYFLQPEPLKKTMEKASRAFDDYQSMNAPDTGHLAAGLAESNLPDKVVAMIALWPRLLSHPNIGSELAKKLGDLLFAARYGSTANAMAARKALVPLTLYKQGNRCPIPDDVLASETLAICVTVAELQRAWHERLNARHSETRDASADAIHEQFPVVMDGCSNQELIRLAQANLIEAAGRLAERATGIATETFVRAWRSKTLEEIKFLELRAHP